MRRKGGPIARWVDSFEKLLPAATLHRLVRHPGTVYGLDVELRIAFVNSAWDRFARENGGEPEIGHRWNLGSAVLDAIHVLLRPFYKEMFLECMGRALGPDDAPVTHEYECPTAQTGRRFRMQLYPLDDDQGLIVVHSILAEGPHGPDRMAWPWVESNYRGADGALRQCSNCRRTASAREEDRWDWVPSLLDHPAPRTTYSLCDVCREYYDRAP